MEIRGHTIIAIVVSFTILCGTRQAGAMADYANIFVFNSSPALGDPNGTPQIGADGFIYGAVQASRLTDHSAVFRVRRDGSGYSLLHLFPTNQIAEPVVLGADNRLYGVAWIIPPLQPGFIYSMNLDGSGYNVLRTFPLDNSEGRRASGTLARSGDGTLFGVLAGGGAHGFGTLYRIGSDGSGFQILHHFSAGTNDGTTPVDAPILGSDGMLYGMTAGGSDGRCVIYRLATNGANYALLHLFDAAAWSNARLTETKDGWLYGATGNTGVNRAGEIFRIEKSGSNFSIIHTFAGEDTQGDSPFDSLLLGEDDYLYGVCEDGGIDGAGLVYRIPRNGGVLEPLRIFVDDFSGDGTTGGGLAAGGDGALYGFNDSGGATRRGTVYRLTPRVPLSIRATPSHFVISWSAPVDGLRLEQSASLGTTAAWTPVAVAPPPTGVIKEVFVPRGTGERYFRLASE